MAKVADLFLLPLEVVEEEEYEAESSSQSEIGFDADLDPSMYWSSPPFEETLVPLSPPIFSPDLHNYEADDHVTLSLDLFDRCPHPETLDTSDFGGLDCGIVDTMSTDYLGLGLGFDVQEQEHEQDHHHHQVEDREGGLQIAAFDFDSESEQDQDPSLPPLCWDSLRLEEERRDFDVDLEWEEVDERLDERDFLSMMVGERSGSSEADEDEEEDPEEVVNVDWEVLLAVNNVVVEDGEYINPSEYEVLFEHFADHESAIRGSPPAAKAVVASLPSVVLTQEDVAKNNAICAVCKDDISLDEKLRRLPCMHHYHGDCILPWLEIRNTCPVCRFELPTDDHEYESLKAQRRARNDGRYDFEMFIEDLV